MKPKSFASAREELASSQSLCFHARFFFHPNVLRTQLVKGSYHNLSSVLPYQSMISALTFFLIRAFPFPPLLSQVLYQGLTHLPPVQSIWTHCMLCLFRFSLSLIQYLWMTLLFSQHSPRTVLCVVFMFSHSLLVCSSRQ